MADNPLKGRADTPNLGKLDPNNYSKEELWKAFYADLDLQVPGAAEFTQQLLLAFWQNKDKINAACEAALERINNDPELRDTKGEDGLSLGANIIIEEYERLFGEKPADVPDLQKISEKTRLAAARDKAEERGAITTINGHVSSFSSDEFLGTLTANYIFN